MNKERKFDDNVFELIIGNMLIITNDFSDGMLLEKVLVLLGLAIFIIGIIRTIMKYKDQNKKGMIAFLVVMGLFSCVAFLGLLYRLIFA